MSPFLQIKFHFFFKKKRFLRDAVYIYWAPVVSGGSVNQLLQRKTMLPGGAITAEIDCF